MLDGKKKTIHIINRVCLLTMHNNNIRVIYFNSLCFRNLLTQRLLLFHVIIILFQSHSYIYFIIIYKNRCACVRVWVWYLNSDIILNYKTLNTQTCLFPNRNRITCSHFIGCCFCYGFFPVYFSHFLSLFDWQSVSW